MIYTPKQGMHAVNDLLEQFHERVQQGQVILQCEIKHGAIDTCNQSAIASLRSDQGQHIAGLGVERIHRFGMPDDELLILDHAYNACRNALNFVAERAGARVVAARIPFPFKTVDELIELVAAVDGLLKDQVERDIANFTTYIDRNLSAGEMDDLRAALIGSKRWTFIQSGEVEKATASLEGDLTGALEDFEVGEVGTLFEAHAPAAAPLGWPSAAGLP